MSTVLSGGAPARRRFRGVSPEARQAERRLRLLAAGLECFGTEGFHPVGVRDVCAHAKLTERYFYESFENREALFLAVYEHAAERIRQVVLGALAGAPSDPVEVARGALRATLRAFKDDPRLARILLIEVFAVGAGMGDALHLVSESFATRIGDVTRSLYPELSEYGLDPRWVANGLYGSTVYVAMRWALDGFEEPLETILAHCVVMYEAFATEMQRRARKRPAARRRPPRKSSRRRTP